MPESQLLQLEDKDKEAKRKADKLAEAMARFQLCVTESQERRLAQLDDLKFLNDEQWSEKVRRDRELAGRPALTVNRIEQFVKHITNSQRQNRISSRVFPVDDGGDIDTAEVLQGLIRHIEYDSKADIAYDTACFFQVAIGEAYWRIVPEYCDPLSFDFDLKIKRIPNPFQVYLDPSHSEPDGSDAKYGFIFEKLTEDEYKASYPDSELASLEWKSIGDNTPGWLDNDGCRIAEYYYTEMIDDVALLVRNPRTGEQVSVRKSEVPNYDALKPYIVSERATQIPVIKWCKFNAKEILEETEVPGRWIPIVKVVGTEFIVDGKPVVKGIVRGLKDAQRQYNVMLSAQTEAISLVPLQTIVAAEGQLEGHEAEWKDANRKPGVRQYKPRAIGQEVLPPPSVMAHEPAVQAMTQAREMAADDLKAMTGVYDASLGARSNETSGKAILSRQQQSEIANFHFQDNLTRSIAHSSRILVDAIPTYYGSERVVRIIGENESHKVVKINQVFEEAGKQKKFDFSVGKYDVVCSAGPNYATKRQHFAEFATQLVAANPETMNVIGDYMMKSLDVPYSQEMSDRYKKMLPPQLQEPEEGQPEVPPEAMQKIQELSQQLAAMNEYAKQAEEKIKAFEANLQVKQLETDSKERIEMHRLELEYAKLESQEAIAALKAEIDAIKVGIQVNAQAAAQEADHAAQAMGAEAEREHQAEMAKAQASKE